MRPALRNLIVLGAVIAAVASLVPAASAAQRTYFAQSPDSAGGPYKVKPAEVYFGAGGALFAKGLRWRSWGEEPAVGRGVAWQRTCVPNCAQGGFRRDPAELRLTRPTQLEGRRQYTCWELEILSGPNSGVAAHGCRPTLPVPPCSPVQTVTVDPVEALGCFSDRGGVKVATGPVRVNGIDIVPDGGVEIELDTRTARLRTSGPVEVRLPLGPYGAQEFVRIARGRLDWQLRAARGFTLRSTGRTPDLKNLPGFDDQVIGGLPIKGSAELKFERGFSRGKLSVELPEYFGGITADVALKTSNDVGLHVDELKLTFPAAVVGGLGLQEASLGMSRGATGAIHWDGSAKVELQPDKGVDEFIDTRTLELAVELGFGPGDGYFRLAGAVDGINKQVYRGIYFQRLGLFGQINPLRFGGSLGFSAGPQIDTALLGKLEAASLDGTYELDLGDPLCYQVTAKGKLVIGDLFDSRWRLCSNGLVEGELGFRATPVPILFGVDGRLSGWIYQNKAFDFEGTVRITAPGPDATGQAVVSNEGMAACFGVGPKVGWSYRWHDRRPRFMSRSCGIGPWRVAKPSSARAAADAQAFRVRRGQRVAVFSAVGTTAAPTVTLVGPRGERVTADADGYADDRMLAAQDPDQRVSYLAVARPSPGRWELQIEPGSAPVSAFRSAAPRAPVRIRARVSTARRGARRLAYRVSGLAGGRVRLIEVGPGIRRVLGTTARARGALRFRPAPGRTRRRRIVAVVLRDGVPEPARPVARFRAPRVARAAAPRHLRIRGRGLRRVISWSGRRGRTYRVSVRLSDGRRLLFFARRRHRVTVRPVLRSTHMRVSVRALDALGRPGRARTARA